MTGEEIKKIVDMIIQSQEGWGEVWLKQAVKNGLKQEWLTLEEAKQLLQEGEVDGAYGEAKAFL